MIGRTLSHYDITAKLGEGGMGEVWRATDTSLHREVAIKVLPEDMAADPERLERFKREAQAIAALSHPNIVTIHSVEEADGVHLLTMELVEGTSLDQTLPTGGFELDKLFPLAIQIANALAAAHEKGIVHRDLKPANVMVTDDGRVKVLDFGLAKLAEHEEAAEETQLMTQAGMILGTVPYMSPEQVQARPVDRRSDIFSLGILLYEMATGQRPFQGDNAASVISAVLKEQPPSVNEVKADLPNHLGRIVKRCLEKDSERRYQSAKDVKNELESLLDEVRLDSITSQPVAESRPLWMKWKIVIPAVLAVAVVAVLTWRVLEERPPAPETRASVEEGGATTASVKASIAVLPFANSSAEPETQYFVDGVHDDLLIQLASLGDLKVISRTSVLEYRDTTKNMRQIGQELGVGKVLEGTVRRAGGRVRINVQLIDAESDENQWAETFDRELTPENIFEIQTEIAGAIATELATTLSGADRSTLARAPTRNQQAYDLYQQARAVSPDSDPEELYRAIELAKDAVELDPEFAVAMGEVARLYMDIYWRTSQLPEHREAARHWIDRALAIAPDDPRLQHVLADHRYHGYLDYEGALVALDKAELGLPGDSDIHHTRGSILRRSGDFDGAFAAIEKALLLDPRNIFALADHGFTYVGIGDVEGARRIARRVLSFTGASDSQTCLALMGELYLLGDTRPMAEFLRSRPNAELGGLADFFFLIPLLERRYEDALAVLERFPDPIVAQLSVSTHSYVRARVLHAQGRIDAAREQAQRAVQELTTIAATMPDNARPVVARALMHAILGNERAARTDAALATDLYPVERDALSGPTYVADGLRALAVFADSKELAEELDRYLALRTKSIYVDYLLLDPVFDRHLDHPAIRVLQEKYSLRNGAA